MDDIVVLMADLKVAKLLANHPTPYTTIWVPQWQHSRGFAHIRCTMTTFGSLIPVKSAKVDLLAGIPAAQRRVTVISSLACTILLAIVLSQKRTRERDLSQYVVLILEITHG